MLSNISVSQTRVKNNPKAYTFGYESVKVKDLDHLAYLANTYSISVPTYNDGHRVNSNVVEGGNYLLIDCDEPNQAQRVEAKIQHYDYVKVPSQSTLNYSYKYHYILPTQIPLAVAPSAMEYQIRRFFNQVGITDKDIDTTGSYDRVRQFAPSVVDKYSVNKGVDTFTYGLTIEEATGLTEVHETGLKVPLVTDIPEDYMDSEIKSCRPKRKLPTVDSEVNTLTNIEGNILDRNKAVYFEGKKVSLDELEAMVFEAIDTAGNSLVSGFGCPCCNSKHSLDYTKGYGYAFINENTGCMVIKCTGNQCKDNPFYTLPVKIDNDMVFTEANITAEDIASSNSFKTRWETILGGVANPMLEDNWKQNFSAFRQVIERNNQGKSPIKIICPSSTGTGKSQQIVQQSINLHGANTKTLIVVLRTEDADILANQIQSMTSSEYVGVYHTNDLTTDVRKDKDAQCLIITHSMFLKHENIVADRNFIVIDEAINAVNHLSIKQKEIKLMLNAYKKFNVANDYVQMIESLSEYMKMVNRSLSNNRHQQLQGDDGDGSNLKLPPATKEMYDAVSNPDFDYMKLASGFVGTKIQNKAITVTLTGILDNLPTLFDNWCYVATDMDNICLNTATEIIPNKSVVIMDATATVNSLYKLYSRYKQNLTVLPKVECRNYSNVNLYTTKHCNTGRSSILNEPKFLESFVDTIKENTTDDDKALVVTFKEMEAKLQSYFNEDTIKVDHWGNLTGTNKYDDCNKIFIFGLNHKPRRVHINNHTLAKGSSRSFLDNLDNQQELYEIETSDLTSEVVQAINRIRCRKPVDDKGGCEPCDVYLTLPTDKNKAYMMLGHIKNEMPNINQQEFSLTVGTEKSREQYNLTERYLQQLSYMCDVDTNHEGVYHEDVLDSLGISSAQFRDNVKGKKLFKTVIADQYTIDERVKLDRRNKPLKKKAIYYYKK